MLGKVNGWLPTVAQLMVIVMTVMFGVIGFFAKGFFDRIEADLGTHTTAITSLTAAVRGNTTAISFLVNEGKNIGSRLQRIEVLVFAQQHN